MADVYKPGDKVQYSEIYRITHDPAHAQEHEVTCVAGKVPAVQGLLPFAIHSREGRPPY